MHSVSAHWNRVSRRIERRHYGVIHDDIAAALRALPLANPLELRNKRRRIVAPPRILPQQLIADEARRSNLDRPDREECMKVIHVAGDPLAGFGSRPLTAATEDCPETAI
jgi:hypothetical protein